MPSQESTWVWATLSKIRLASPRKRHAAARCYKAQQLADGQNPGERLTQRETSDVRTKPSKINETTDSPKR